MYWASTHFFKILFVFFILSKESVKSPPPNKPEGSRVACLLLLDIAWHC